MARDGGSSAAKWRRAVRVNSQSHQSFAPELAEGFDTVAHEDAGIPVTG